MKALVDIDDSLLRLASELTGQKEKSELVNMGLRALIKKPPAGEFPTQNAPDQNTQSTIAVSDNKSTAPRRTLGSWEDIWIADDFDETSGRIY